jgi:hypothetical protein
MARSLCWRRGAMASSGDNPAIVCSTSCLKMLRQDMRNETPDAVFYTVSYATVTGVVLLVLGFAVIWASR